MVRFRAKWIEFRASPIHGEGGFASKDIPVGTRVIEYGGRVICKQESLRQCELKNPFLFFLNFEQDLDGNVPSNPARLLNHSCRPNCEAELLRGRIWIMAKRAIKSGEEITFNYGYDLECYRDYPCSCGAQDCIGYILAEELHADLSRQAVSSLDG